MEERNRRWGGPRLSAEAVAAHLGLPVDLVTDVLDEHDVILETAVGLDHMVIVFPPVGDHEMTWVPILCDPEHDHRAEVVARYNELREAARLEGRWDERPRLDDLADMLNAVSTDEFGWTTVHDFYDEIADVVGHPVELVGQVIAGYWGMIWSGGPDLDDLSFFFGRNSESERDLEDWIADELEVFDAIGMDLELWTAPDGRSGRQYTLADRSRPDLICRDRVDGSLWVVELKAWPLYGADVEQVERYVTTLNAQHGIDARGLLVSNGTMVEGRVALAANPSLRHVNIARLRSGAPIDE